MSNKIFKQVTSRKRQKPNAKAKKYVRLLTCLYRSAFVRRARVAVLDVAEVTGKCF